MAKVLIKLSKDRTRAVPLRSAPRRVACFDRTPVLYQVQDIFYMNSAVNDIVTKSGQRLENVLLEKLTANPSISSASLTFKLKSS